MFGIRTEFTYVECGSCGCLQLIDPPSDMSSYYPLQYYSYRGRQVPDGLWYSATRRIRQVRNRTYFGVGLQIRSILRLPGSHDSLYAFSRTGATKHSRILDVGCGSGILLQDLLDVGFRNILGIDPFIEQDLEYANGLRIQKRHLVDMGGTTWDVIMFHHSFEHMADPRGTLEITASLLPRGGHCLIRVPVVSWAWEHYGPNWVQVDAPRHLFLHSERSMQILAEQAGLTVTSVEYDSTEDQFIGSELYTRDVPRNSIKPDTISKFFSESDLRRFQGQTKMLNRQKRGDQASFHLLKT
jgi:SAM-dependent methyltransferase